MAVTYGQNDDQKFIQIQAPIGWGAELNGISTEDFQLLAMARRHHARFLGYPRLGA